MSRSTDSRRLPARPARRWWIALPVLVLIAASFAALLAVRRQRMQTARAGGRLFHVALPNGEEKTIIVRPVGEKRRDWEWNAW